MSQALLPADGWNHSALRFAVCDSREGTGVQHREKWPLGFSGPRFAASQSALVWHENEAGEPWSQLFATSSAGRGCG